MRSVRVPLAAAAACVSMFAAGQAGAVTKLVFEITADNPALGTFQQTWTLEDGVGVTNTLNAPTILYGYIGEATATASPVTDAFLTQTHVTSYEQTSFDFTRGIDETDPTAGSIGFSLSQFGQAKYDYTSTQHTHAYYSVSIFASSYGLTLPDGEPTMADLIAYVSDPDVYLIWSENAQASRMRTRDDGYISGLYNDTYYGRARLVSVDYGNTAPIPEPSAWALMILGFAAAGTTLRRRRTLAA